MTDDVITAKLPDYACVVKTAREATTPRERLEFLSELLRVIPPENFDMSDWQYRSARAQQRRWCGTAGCIAGWAAVFWNSNKFNSPRYEGAEALSLTYEQAESLFVPGGVVLYDVTPTQAADVIDNYLATGEIDWNPVRVAQGLPPLLPGDLDDD
jgi:hypothetical protein